MKYWVLGLLVLLMLYTVFEICRSALSPDAEEFLLSVRDLPPEFEGFRIAFFSDLHEASLARRLPEKADAAKPDLLLFGGDMLHKHRSSASRSLALMQSLAAKYPTYAACGNHEEIIKENDPALWNRFLTETSSFGVRWLQNEWIPLKKGNGTVYLGGISVYYDYYYHPKGHSASDYLGNDTRKIDPPPDGVRILMAHDPIQLGIYTKWGIDLVLSGHVHGGIVRLPGMGGLLSPARTFCPPRDNGLYKRGNTQMVVSRGLGNRAFIPRFWNRPHLPVIILTKESSHEEI